MLLSMFRTDSDVAEGEYVARFVGAERLAAKDRRGDAWDGPESALPPGMVWRFEVAEGADRGKQVERVTGLHPTPGNACGKMLKAVCGGTPRSGERVNLFRFIGRRYRITVATGKCGVGTVVEEVILVPG